MLPFYKAEGIRYDYVVHVERLDQEMAQVARKRGLLYTPRIMNRTNLPRTPVKGYLGNLSAREVSEMNFNYDNFITPDTLRTIQQIYAVDFTTLGYTVNPHDGFHGTRWTGLLNRAFPGLGRLTGR